MNDLDQFEQPQHTTSRSRVTDEERRRLLEKRIKELRKRKRREQHKSKRPARILAAVLLAAFFLLFLSTSIYTLASSGEERSYRVVEIPASNLEEINGRALSTGVIIEPAISAAAAFLEDSATGDVLYEKNADQSLPMASTTKIMTAILVLENTSMSERVTISEYASSVGESSAWLEQGETLTVQQLLYALLVQSANDAAVALAEHVAGSEAAFVEMMNDKAAELGLEHTHFSNPHGLDQEGHYTSARDLATVAVYAMGDERFREIVVSDGYEIPWPGHQYPRVLENHNKLLQMYPFATGIKTGYTLGAGKCLVASAQKDGCELVSVILNGGDSYWDQTISLMEYGFNDFSQVEFAYSGQPLQTVEVGDFPRRQVDAVPLTDLVFTVRNDELESFTNADIYCLQWVSYPVRGDQELGYMIVGEGSTHERREPLVSDEYRITPNFLIRFLSFIAAVFAVWWKGILWLIPGL